MLYDFIKEVFEVIVNSATEVKSKEAMLKEYCYDTFEDLLKDTYIPKNQILNFIEKNHHFYFGGFSSEDRNLEAGLCETNFNINTEDFTFNQRGGY
jgi:hypothetical protein